VDGLGLARGLQTGPVQIGPVPAGRTVRQRSSEPGGDARSTQPSFLSLTHLTTLFRNL
jgi:hypothetical protein